MREDEPNGVVVSVVVCTPGGAQGEVLARAGADQAKLSGAELVLLRYVQATGEAERGPESVVDEALGDLRSQARSFESNGITCRAEVVTGPGEDAGPKLLEAIRRIDAELVVIGIRSRSRVGKLLLGSIAQDLLLAAGRKVLAVPVEPGS